MEQHSSAQSSVARGQTPSLEKWRSGLYQCSLVSCQDTHASTHAALPVVFMLTAAVDERLSSMRYCATRGLTQCLEKWFATVF